MSELFLKLLNMSITASWLILAVVVLRLVLKKAPKWVNCVLWALVAVRLVCPFSFESKLSLVPDVEPVGQYVSQSAVNADIEMDETTGEIESVVSNPVYDPTVETMPNTGNLQSDYTPQANGQRRTAVGVAAAIWLTGMIVLLLYALISYLRLRKRVAAAIPIGNKVWLCDAVESPFILGFFRPRIYLPSNISEGDMEHVLAHERAHLQRRDHWWKPLGYVLLAVYWFNPLIWVAYILLCRDIELACDEKVIKRPETDRKAYSEALLACSVKRSAITACPLAFGEVSVRGRIKSVLNYKKPAFWIILVALVACIVAAVCFLTDPIKPTVHDVSDQKGYRITTMVRNVTMPVTVPVDVLGEDIYSNEGHVYEPDEVVVYQNGTTTVYLEHVRYLEQYGEKHLYFDFRFDYEILDGGMVRALFEPNIKDGKTASSSIGCGVSNRMAWDSSATYLDGARLYGVNQGVEVSVAIKTDVVQSAQDYIAFDLVGLTDIFYEKGKANHEDDIEILTTEEEYRAYIQEKYDVYNVARQNNVDPEELTDAIIEGLSTGFFSPFVELEVLDQAVAAVGRADEPISVIVDSDKVDASNPALDTAKDYVTKRMETFNESWKTIATGNQVTEGKVTALEPVASTAMENVRLDLYRLEYRLHLDGNPYAVENGGMSHEEVDGEVWLTEWESLGQPYILHYSAVEDGRIDWKTIAVTSTEEIGNIYAENRNMETELGLDKYTIVIHKLYAEYLKNGTDEPIVNYRGWLTMDQNGDDATVADSMVAAVEKLLAEELPATISMFDETGRAHPVVGRVEHSYDAWSSINGKNSCHGILDHTYQEVDSIETSDTRITLGFTANGEEWGLVFYEGTDTLSVFRDGAEYLLEATPKQEDVFLSPLGSLIRRWYDEAEYMTLDGYYGKLVVVPNTGQDYLEAAQTWCETYESVHLLTSPGSKECYSYVSCRVEPAEGATELYREKGEIGENTYAFFAYTTFVPENEQALQWSMAGNTGAYEGDDPDVPEGAYEYTRCGYITLEEDGWHGVIAGTGF